MKLKKNNEEKRKDIEFEDDEEIEELNVDELEEVEDDEFEIEDIEEDDDFEEDEENEDVENIEEDDDFEEDEEYEDIEDIEEDDDFEEDEEYEDTEDIEEDDDFEEDEEYEELEDIEEDDDFEEDEEYEELEDIEEDDDFEEDEEYEDVEDIEEDDDFEEDEEYEDTEDIEEDDDFEEDEEYEDVEEIEEDDDFEEDEEYEDVEDIEEDDDIEEDEEYENAENSKNKEENEIINNEETEDYDNEIDNDVEEDDNDIIVDGEDENNEFEETEADEYIDEELDNDEEILEDTQEDDESEEGSFPEELVDLELECIYIGLMFNNPKAISRFYFLYEDCQFSDDELMNLYKIIIFRDGEAYASAAAKDKFQLPKETPSTYDLKLKVQKIAAAKRYNLENVYIELKKLFILKKNYLVAPTSAIQQKILEIQNYELYADMTVEEVENALEQITVTTGLTQGRLNENVTDFLLSGGNELSNGISIPFNILSTVFKGLRKGETMCYAMPSNSGKSRFTINLASYISFIHKEKVLIISNEMSEEKMKLCMITTILNNPEMQEIHGQKLSITEGELLELKFRPDKGKRVKCDEDGYILRKDNETQEEYVEKLRKNSSVFKQTLAVTDWINTQINNSIFFIHITEHTNDDLRKIIMNYYYKEGIQYMFYDTLKADTANIGNSDEVKKTATILSNLAQKFKIFIASSMQLLESNTLPVNLTVNDMSASKTVKEVLDTLCLIKQISRRSLYKYEYADTDQFDKCYDIDVPKDTDVRFYACVVDKNRAGAKPTVLFRLNLAYNRWEELGYLRMKQTEIQED